MAKVLVVDDEVKLGTLVAEALELDGHDVRRVERGEAGLEEISARVFDVVVTDLRMPEVDGLALLRQARTQPRPPDVIMMTAFGTAENAVEAMKAGAADYLTKPFSMDELRMRVRRLTEQRRSHATTRRLMAQLTPSLVIESPAMTRVLAQARQVAATDATTLLLGESGTGKTELARWIHFSSGRASGPFVEVHCSALSETLLESELFGHEKGAFTGASNRKEGHLAAADGGTLFLDEIGEISLATQVKLLRFLQSREFTPVGSTETQRVDARIIAATNRDLEEALREGALREDFFYRLNVFSIQVPPLRERHDDVIALAEGFLRRRGVGPSRLSASARSALTQHPWRGNVRELENALERALIVAGAETIRSDHFAFAPTGQKVPALDALLIDGFNLDGFERDLIHAALARAGGNKTAAAKLLGITRRRLYSRLDSLGEPSESED